MKALQAYQAYLGEIKSDQRDKAAADSVRSIVIISPGYYPTKIKGVITTVLVRSHYLYEHIL